ncbi:hypothetical protein N9N67_04590 [Bacteriovoracaceae bacterium]|nr:hypothetical protein [Bacteriovoracaceae bacterium]
MKFLFICLLSFFFNINLQGTTGFNSFQGIVEVPKLFGKRVLKGPPGSVEIVKGELKIYQEANKNSKALFVLNDKNRNLLITKLRGHEFEYEYQGLDVFGIKENWYKIEIINLEFIKKYKTRYVWIKKTDTGAFHPYQKLLKSNMTYLDPFAFNGNLYKGPNRRVKVKIENLNFKNKVDIKVVDKKGSFFKVEVYTSNGCGETVPSMVGTYWVPATNLKGRPNIWYYSRGC